MLKEGFIRGEIGEGYEQLIANYEQFSISIKDGASNVPDDFGLGNT